MCLLLINGLCLQIVTFNTHSFGFFIVSQRSLKWISLPLFLIFTFWIPLCIEEEKKTQTHTIFFSDSYWKQPHEYSHFILLLDAEKKHTINSIHFADGIVTLDENNFASIWYFCYFPLLCFAIHIHIHIIRSCCVSTLDAFVSQYRRSFGWWNRSEAIQMNFITLDTTNLVLFI